jgi:phosphoglycolate phosphatase-like HAD superfamily hydrolase
LPKYLALDLDGTLLDARPRQVAVAVAVVAAANHVVLPRASFWELKREGVTTAAALAALGYPNSHKLAEEWRAQIENDEWLRLDNPLPGAAVVLRRARAAGLAVHVITARSRPEAVSTLLSRLLLTDLIDHVTVVTPNAAVQAKRAALRRFATVGFIGDSEADGQASTQADIPFVAVSTGQRSGTFLRKHGFVVRDRLSEAVALLSAG